MCSHFMQILLLQLHGLHDELKEKATKGVELGDYDVVDSLCGLLKSVEYHEDNLRTSPTEEAAANAQHFLDSYSQLTKWIVCLRKWRQLRSVGRNSPEFLHSPICETA